MRNAFNHRIQDFFHTQTCLTRCTDDFFTLTAQQFHDFIFHFVRHGAIHVALVHDRNDFEVVFQSHVKVRDSLCLYTLRCIDYQQGTFASSDGTGYFVRKVHVSRGIDQIENVFFTLIGIFHLNGMTLDGDTSLLFQIHIVQHLSLGHLDGLSIFQKTVGQGRFAVVDMRNNAEVSNMLHLTFNFLYLIRCKDTKKMRWTTSE